MKYKLIAVDIDGTLLDSNGTITEVTKNAIKTAVDSGIVFVICSGRSIQGVEYLNSELSLDLPFITYNGAMIVMGKSKEVLYEQRLSQNDAEIIIELGKKYATTMIVWSDNKLYVSELNEKSFDYKKHANVEPVLKKNMEELAKNGITKILWYDDIEKIDYYEAAMGELLSDSVNYHTSKPMFLEFVDKNASKAIAMEKLGDHLGIKSCEMIAKGDGFNDLSMIEYAGLGVAMGNAKQAIKEKADYVTSSNDEDGVANVINKFILGQ